MNFKNIFKKNNEPQNNNKNHLYPVLSTIFDIKFSNVDDIFRGLEEKCRTINVNEYNKTICCEFLELKNYEILTFLKKCKKDNTFMENTGMKYLKYDQKHQFIEYVVDFMDVKVIDPHHTMIYNYAKNDINEIKPLLIKINFSYIKSNIV